MIKHRKNSTDQANHEDLFLERYEWLLAFARQLRDVDAQRAEDIVHDAFVQFIVCCPPLDRIGNLDWYLQRMARTAWPRVATVTTG
jgi:DNA-directed RNA polymerase specialized sigma24 family protein